MRIGITYDLRAEYLAAGHGEEETAELDRPDTIDGIGAALVALGHEPVPIGSSPSLMARLLAGERYDLVFNIAEGLYGVGRESLVPALLDAYRIPYTFSDPLVLALSLHKGMAKRVVRDLGLATPDFAVVETPGDLATLRLPFPLFVKPVAEGTSKGISGRSRVDSRGELLAVGAELLARFAQPVLVEGYLPGREFTVGIVGTGAAARALGALEVLLGPAAEPGVYSYDNKAHWEGRVSYQLATDALARAAMALARGAWRGLGCRDGGRVDVRADAAGRPCFIEVNPLAGLNPTISDLAILCTQQGIEYVTLINEILQSALRRVPAVGEQGRAASLG